jgi:hypothetical protein
MRIGMIAVRRTLMAIALATPVVTVPQGVPPDFYPRGAVRSSSERDHRAGA